MPKNGVMRQVQTTLRRMPFLFKIAFHSWRLIQPKYSLGAVGVLMDADGRILLVEHAFHPRDSWGLPGGWVNRNEDPAVTVRRELHEELSLGVEVGPIILAESPFRNHLDLAYLCRSSEQVGKLSFELLDYGWFAPDELPHLLTFHRRAVARALELRQISEFHQWLQH